MLYEFLSPPATDFPVTKLLVCRGFGGGTFWPAVEGFLVSRGEFFSRLESEFSWCSLVGFKES